MRLYVNFERRNSTLVLSQIKSWIHNTQTCHCSVQCTQGFCSDCLTWSGMTIIYWIDMINYYYWLLWHGINESVNWLHDYSVIMLLLHYVLAFTIIMYDSRLRCSKSYIVLIWDRVSFQNISLFPIADFKKYRLQRYIFHLTKKPNTQLYDNFAEVKLLLVLTKRHYT